MPGFILDGLGRAVFDAIFDTATGSPIWLVLLGLIITLGAAYANANRDAIKDFFRKQKTALKDVLTLIFLIALFFLIWGIGVAIS